MSNSRTARALLPIALGLATTLAAAWACWLTLDPTKGRFDIVWASSDGVGSSVSRVRRTGSTGWYFARLAEPVGAPEASLLVPSWLARRVEEWPLADGQLVATRAVHAWGWPFLSLWSEAISNDGSAPNAARRPPLRPLWRGLLASTALYAPLWAVLLYVPPSIRRRVRRARGLCPACGYDLAGAPPGPCPECAHEQRLQGSARPAPQHPAAHAPR